MDISLTILPYLSTRVLESHDSSLPSYNVMLCSRYQKPYQSGFTMLELVTVIAIMGILSVVIIPTFNNVSGNAVYARGFHDETLALLRFGQKTAVAQRRTVCVMFSDTTSVTLTIAATADTPTCNTDLQGPKGGSALGATITAKSGVAYSATPNDFSFDGLGQPVDSSGALVPAQTIQVVNAAKVITVETVTGYTHD